MNCVRCLGPKDGNHKSWCIECKRSYDREYYHKNHDKMLLDRKQVTKKVRKKRIDIIFKLKSVPCKDCNIQYKPWQMQFDHLRDKKFNIGDANSVGMKLNLILEEVKKCDVVCANCHADRTYNRRYNQGLGKSS
jgi:hypothetical protein